MHSSKGLEYDIVFALGVLNRSKKPDLLVPEGLGGISPQLIAVNDENDPRYIAHCQELDAEKIRQLYVAFTRAKQRLYIPIMPSQGDKLPAIGTASPIELYLAHLPLADRQATALYDRIATPLSALHPWLHGLAGRYKVTFSELSKGSMPAEAITVPPPNALLELSPALEAIVPRTVNYLHSFTALAAKSKGLVRSHPEATPVTAPQDYGCAIQNRHTLPAGSEIGILLHAILEVIPFSIGANGPNDPAFSRFVEGHLRHTPFASWLPVICEIIHSALHAELPVTDPFTVSNIATCNCYREHEFVYITQPPLHGTFAEQPGYVKGVIDLMFTHKGKYYLLDWKSNWLGPTAEAYGEQQLLAAMSAHDYFLQAKLYRHALASYLALFDPRPFEELFGGIFFLFLRGLSSGCSKGIVLYK
jgi:exodeoxyribonuclease V beta subunit